MDLSVATFWWVLAGVAVATCTDQPASRRRISVPAQRNSASSGWARMASAVRFMGALKVV